MKQSDRHRQVLNKHLEGFLATNEFFKAGTTYYEMADFLQLEGKKDANKFRELGYKMKVKAFPRDNLKQYLESGAVQEVEFLSANDSCENCKKLNGKRIFVAGALSKMPLPLKECTHKYGCRCVFIPVTGLEDVTTHWDSSKQEYV